MPSESDLAALRAAMASGDPERIADHVQLPFLFEGSRHARAAFVERVAPQLFNAEIRRCLRQALPHDDGGRPMLDCSPYQFYLERSQLGWRIAEFAADPESLGASPPTTTPAASLEAHLEVLSRGDAPRLAILLQAGTANSLRGPRRASLLHLASSYHYAREQAALVRTLLAAGADPQARDQSGRMPLHWAAGFGCAECVSELLAAGAPVDAAADDGRTALFTATEAIVPRLLAAGADPLARDAQGNVPLHLNLHPALLAAGVNVRNRFGLTPLHHAALRGDRDGIAWLLERGADPAAQTTESFEHREGVLAREHDPVYAFAAGQRAYDLALWQHDRVKWSTGRFRPAVELLDSVTPRRSLFRR